MEKDTKKIGLTAARMMEKVEDEYPDGTTVHEAIMVVSLIVPEPEELQDEEVEIDDDSEFEPGHAEVVDFYSTTPLRSSQIGMIDIGREQIIRNFKLVLLEEDEDDDEDDD